MRVRGELRSGSREHVPAPHAVVWWAMMRCMKGSKANSGLAIATSSMSRSALAPYLMTLNAQSLV
jgi:hypothetical protein